MPGDGDLALDAFIEAALDTGYTGAFELEVVGPAIEAEGHGAALRRARRAGQRTAARGPPVSRAIVFNGDETWEERDLPVPDPQPGGAVLRVEATGLCHSDFDHFQGRVHTPWGGEFPSIAGHEIVGRIETHRSGGRRGVGRRRGRPRRGARHGRRPRDGFRIYGHDFSVDEGSGLYGGFAEHLELLPGSMVYRLRDDLPAEELTFFEPLSCAVTWVHPIDAGRRRRHRRAGPHGHGDDRRRARRGRARRSSSPASRRIGSASTPRCGSVPIT